MVIAATIMLAIIATSFVSFNTKVSNHLHNNVETRLNEIVTPSLASFELQVGEQIKKVRTLADFLGHEGELGDDMQKQLLISSVEQNGLLRCAIAFPDGSFITHDDRNGGNVSNDPFFVESMKGNFFISDPRPAVVDDTKSVMLFACPIERDGKVIGSLIFSYLCDDMDRIFSLNILEGKGQMFVAKQDGTPLIGNYNITGKHNNMLDYLRNICSHRQHNNDGYLDLVGEQGIFLVTNDEYPSPLYLRYDKLNTNDWYLISMAFESDLSSAILSILNSQQNLGIITALCVAFYIALLIALWLVNLRELDKMTGLLTVGSFKRKAASLLASNTARLTYVIIQLDVKDFKLINRIYSFEVGNTVIKNISIALKRVIDPAGGLVARVGTDDFLLLIPYPSAEPLAKMRNDFISIFYELMGDNFKTTVNFPTGQYLITELDYPNPDISVMIERANMAHCYAKNKVDTIIDFVEDIEKEALFEKEIEDRMLGALNDEEFKLYLQPKYSTVDETMCGAEALVRWNVAGKIIMHPIDFIPVLERNGFIVKLDMYMFTGAVKKLRSLMDDGIHPVPISVNFSKLHLCNSEFATELSVIADRYNVPHELLEIELTESSMIGDLPLVVRLIHNLHQSGFKVSMDDFGCDYSSLAHLRELDVDIIKIDKGFFDPSSNPERARLVVAGILNMAKSLHVVTAAEGIESKDQVLMLRELQCDIIQGFYYSRPIPGADIDDMLPPASEQLI